MTEQVVDLFAGPGGWDLGARALGLDPLGIEVDEATCETREAASLATVRGDVAEVDPLTFRRHHLPGDVTGLIASPPCPEFSSANGKRQGLQSESGALVWQVLRWAEALKTEWIACEQVPQVLPIWRYIANRLEQQGYWTTVGVVDAANYGLPQNRERAVLLAHVRYRPTLPSPTHTEFADYGLPFEADLQPWVTLADALGLATGWVYDSGQMSTLGGGVRERYVRSCDRPAGTLTGQTRSQWVLKHGDRRRKLTFAEACRLQGFPEGYPFQGKADERDQQLGNAVPPPLAARLLAAVTNRQVAYVAA